MDNKENNNRHLPINDLLNWKSLGFFSAEDYLLYVFKKTEKITAALYLVSGLLKDEEPIKWELRDKGVDLLNSSFTASSAVPGDKNAIIQSLFTSALETISLLNIAKVSNLISDMNHQILVREIDGILSLMRDRLIANAENAGYVLSDAFFRTPELYTTGFKSTPQGDAKRTSGENFLKDKDINKGQTDPHIRHSERQQAILNTLKGQSKLTVKDFTNVIKDCSEKTIQRELLALVEIGLIKKEGERRWSRYSLK